MTFDEWLASVKKKQIKEMAWQELDILTGCRGQYGLAKYVWEACQRLNTSTPVHTNTQQESS